MDKIEKYRALGNKAKKGNTLKVHIEKIENLIDSIESFDPKLQKKDKLKDDKAAFAVVVEGTFSLGNVNSKDLAFFKELLKYLSRQKDLVENEMNELEAKC